MKASIIPAALVIMLLSCERLEPRLQSGLERRDCYGSPALTPVSRDTLPEDHPDLSPGDTVIWLCTVEYPPEYPWRRDTLHQDVTPEIVLYRNYLPVLRFTAGEGASPDPDMLHIVDGHLYSEDSSMSRTVVRKDGVELYRCDGREMLFGLVEDGQDIYTLSQRRSGEGFSYRRNGELLLSRESGRLYGSLSDPSYGPGGALYRDGGDLVFGCHYDMPGMAGYGFFRNGEETCSEPGDYQDVKCIGGRLEKAPSEPVLYVWDELRIWSTDRGIFWAGTGSRDMSLSSRGAWLYDAGLKTMYMMGKGDALVMPSGESAVSVWYGRDGEVDVFWWDKGACMLDGRYMYMGDACVSLLGETLAVALTPREHGASPVVLVDGRARTLDINGYISCIKICLYT